MQVKRLVILGGPSCIGKSFLINQIRNGSHHTLCGQLGISADTPTIEAGAVSQAVGVFPSLILHYDFVRQMRGGLVRVLPEAIAASEQVSYVTLVASIHSLKDRVRKRLRRHLHGIAHGSWPALYYGVRFLPALPTYYLPGRLDDLYQRWYDFMAAHPGEHWMLDTTHEAASIALERVTPRQVADP